MNAFPCGGARKPLCTAHSTIPSPLKRLTLAFALNRRLTSFAAPLTLSRLRAQSTFNVVCGSTDTLAPSRCSSLIQASLHPVAVYLAIPLIQASRFHRPSRNIFVGPLGLQRRLWLRRSPFPVLIVSLSPIQSPCSEALILPHSFSIVALHRSRQVHRPSRCIATTVSSSVGPLDLRRRRSRANLLVASIVVPFPTRPLRLPRVRFY